MEDVKEKISKLDTTKILDKLEKRKLEYELECIKEDKEFDWYETYTADNGELIVDASKPTPLGNAIKIQQAVRRSGLEDLLNRHTFENFEAKEDYQIHMKQKAMAFAKQPKGLFIISAQSGVGKTHLSTAICGYIMLRGKEVRYMKWVDEIESIKSADYKDSVPMLNEVKKADILYIDDFLKADLRKEPSPADIERAFAIIDYRDIKELPTIISTEMTYEDIKGWNTALAGRIVEMAKDNFVFINYGKDRNYRENFIQKGV